MKAEAGVYAGLAFALTVLVACAGGPLKGPADPAMIYTAAPARDPAAAASLASARGFLTPETTPDAAAIIAPAPREGELRNDADWAMFRATRLLEGSDRWALAISDDNYRPAALLAAFSCAVGVQLSPENSPALADILARTTVDAGLAAAGAKDVYKRTRPFLHNPGNICIARSAGLDASYDYPSGHGSLGWTAGLVIASLAPDRSTPILARARAFGESRIVCGLHNASAIDAARTNAASVFAALQGSPEYQAAITTARSEIAAARASAAHPDAAACAREAELTKPLAMPQP